MSVAATQTQADGWYMRRALRLATRSLGMTAPNPGVGCVIARGSAVLGQGRHEYCGGPHAEINALADARARGHDPAGATVYVTLSPCTRHGRTPPCTQALIEARVSRVVAALSDPVQDDAGAVLGAAGMSYTVGCEETLARHLHGGWLCRVVTGRPRCTGKWAMSMDGFLAPGDDCQAAISSAPARASSRRRRRTLDALVVGADTVRVDNPQLLATGPRHPARVVLSARARLDDDRALWQHIHQAPIWLIHDQRAPASQCAHLRQRGVVMIAVADAHNPGQVLAALADRGCNEVMVEGGARVHAAFIAANAYDRVEIDQGAALWGGGLSVAHADNACLNSTWQLEQRPVSRGGTVCTRWRKQHD